MVLNIFGNHALVRAFLGRAGFPTDAPVQVRNASAPIAAVGELTLKQKAAILVVAFYQEGLTIDRALVSGLARRLPRFPVETPEALTRLPIERLERIRGLPDAMVLGVELLKEASKTGTISASSAPGGKTMPRKRVIVAVATRDRHLSFSPEHQTPRPSQNILDALVLARERAEASASSHTPFPESDPSAAKRT